MASIEELEKTLGDAKKMIESIGKDIENEKLPVKNEPLGSDFWKSVIRKLVETFISVKVWTIFGVLGLSTHLLVNKFISGGEWGMLNGGVISTVFAMREYFKVEKVRSEDDSTYIAP